MVYVGVEGRCVLCGGCVLCTHMKCHCSVLMYAHTSVPTSVPQVLQDFSTAQPSGGGPDPVLQVSQQPGKQRGSLVRFYLSES